MFVPKMSGVVSHKRNASKFNPADNKKLKKPVRNNQTDNDDLMHDTEQEDEKAVANNATTGNINDTTSTTTSSNPPAISSILSNYSYLGIPSSLFSGTWIYRSFLNIQKEVGEDNIQSKVLWGEGTFILNEYEPGLVSGNLNFSNGAYLLNSIGSVNGNSIQIRSEGDITTEAKGWIYEHKGSMAPKWEYAYGQVPVFVGSVYRTVAHGPTSLAGEVGSFYCTKVDPISKSITAGIQPLFSDTLLFLNQPSVRLHHQLFYLIRANWDKLSEDKKDQIKQLGWKIERASVEYTSVGNGSFVQNRFYSDNGSGEDFLFHNRWMLQSFCQLAANNHKNNESNENQESAWKGWITIPGPEEDPSPSVPPPWINLSDISYTKRLTSIKSDEFYFNVIKPYETKLKDPKYLRNITLGELGSEIECCLHYDILIRWAALTRDPITRNIIKSRDRLDYDPKWFGINYDNLDDSFSCHLNPIFWKFRYWIDNRIDDWFAAQNKAGHSIEEVVFKQYNNNNIKWFRNHDNGWVTVKYPWAGFWSEIVHEKQGSQYSAATMKNVIALILSK